MSRRRGGFVKNGLSANFADTVLMAQATNNKMIMIDEINDYGFVFRNR